MDKSVIVLEGIPVPPSSNNQYSSCYRNGRIIHFPAMTLKKYKRDFSRWAFANSKVLKLVGDMGREGALEVEIFIGFHKQKLLNKQGGFKKNDISNRIKSLHDCLSEAAGIDDSCFFSVTAEKFIVDDSLPEQAIIRLSPFLPRHLSDISMIVI